MTRRTQTLAGQDFGAHIPKQEAQDEFIAYINGDFAQPATRGTVVNQSISSGCEHFIQSTSGHRVLMDDHAPSSKILLETAGAENQCVMENGVMLRSGAGDIVMNAQENMHHQSGESVEINAGETVSIRAADQHFSAGESLAMHATGDYILTSQDQLSISASDDMSLQCGERMIHVHQKAYRLQCEGEITAQAAGECFMNAYQKNVMVHAEEGPVSFKVGGSEIVLHPNGHIMLKSQKVTVTSAECHIPGNAVFT